MIVRAVALAAALGLSGCIIVQPGPPPPVVGDGVTAELDTLVLVNMDPSALQLGPELDDAVALLGWMLEEEGIALRTRAVAPLHRRVGDDTVPLFDGALPVSLHVNEVTAGAQAMTLRDVADDDYDNLRQLGPSLGTAPLYRGDANDGLPGAAVFPPPSDGMLVIIVTSRAPRCEGGDCLQSASRAAELLLATREDGGAAWLRTTDDVPLSPEQLPVYVLTAPEVGDAHEDLVSACLRRPNFPTAAVDFLEPGPPYHSQVVAALEAGGVAAQWIDLCGLFSSDGEGLARRAAANVTAAFR